MLSLLLLNYLQRGVGSRILSKSEVLNNRFSLLLDVPILASYWLVSQSKWRNAVELLLRSGKVTIGQFSPTLKLSQKACIQKSCFSTFRLYQKRKAKWYLNYVVTINALGSTICRKWFFDNNILSSIHLLMLVLFPDRKLCTCSSANHIIISHTPFSFESSVTSSRSLSQRGAMLDLSPSS